MRDTPPLRIPLTVLVATRNEEANLERCLASVHGCADQIFVLDSESADRTVEIARRYADEVRELPYEHGRIIPWIFQWGLDHLPIAQRVGADPRGRPGGDARRCAQEIDALLARTDDRARPASTSGAGRSSAASPSASAATAASTS